VGGVADHVHIALRLGRTIDIATLIRELKRESSKWIKQESRKLSKFQWQSGYGAFSVSPSHVNALTKYTENQEEHHRQESFQDEFRRLRKKYGLELDERYARD
jgi:REP element-mobilizing transposase RayT